MYFRRMGKYLKQGGHWSVLESASSAPPDSFFQQEQKHTISNFRGGICTLCPTAAHASGQKANVKCSY